MKSEDRILIVGGLGFVGRALVQGLRAIKIDPPKQITVIDNESVEPAETFASWPKKNRPIYHKIDILKIGRFREILRRVKPNIIYWLAAKQGYDNDWINYAKTNVLGAYILWESFQTNGVELPEKIVLASSQAVYRPMEAVRENCFRIPPSIYGLTKLQQEEAFFNFAARTSVSLVSLRYSIILGGGQSLQSTESGILRNWWKDFEAGRRPQVYGNGKQIRDFVSINDVTRANIAALRYPKSGFFNIGGPSMQVSVMAELFSQEAGAKEPKITNKNFRPGGEYNLYSDCTKASRELKWEPKETVRQMIKNFLKSARTK